MPVLIQNKLNDRFSFHAGPQLSFLFAAREESGSNGYDTKSDFKTADLGLAVGGSVELLRGVNFTARYCLGLLDIDKLDVGTTRNNGLQLTLGYRIMKAKKKEKEEETN